MTRWNRLFAIASRGAAVLFAFAVTVAVTRILSLGEAGTYFLVTSTITLLSSVGRLGTDVALLKLTAAQRVLGGTEFRRLLGIGLLSSVCASVAVAGVLVLVMLGGDQLPPLQLALVSSAVLAQAVSVILGSILRARGLVSLGAFAEVGSVPLLVLTGIAALHVGGMSSLGAFLLVYAAANWLTLGWAALATLAVRRRGTEALPGSDVPPARTSLASLISMMGSTVAVFAATWAPLVVLNAGSGAGAVAQFNAASKLAGFLTVFPTIQQSYLAPELARLFARGETETLSRLAGREALTAVAISALPALAFVVAPHHILTAVMGAGYLDAAWVLILLSASALVVTALGQTSLLLLLTGSEHVAALANIGVLVAWFSLGWPVSAWGGAIGVAALSAVISIAYALSGTLILRRRSAIRPYVRWA